MKIERVQAIYSELEKYEVTLDPDPVSRGPRYLQGLIATCRNHLNAVSKLLLEVHREKQGLARDLHALEAAFQVSFDDMLANDERVRRLPSIEDRKSTARVFLRNDLVAIDNTKSFINDLEFVEKAIKHRHRELSATMSEIKLQKSLIQTEIQTGAMYGDERAVEVKGGPAGVDIDEDELDLLFEQEVKKDKSAPQLVLAAPDEPEVAPVAVLPVEPVKVEPKPVEAVLPTVVTEDDVSAFLGSVDETGATEAYDDVFQNI